MASASIALPTGKRKGEPREVATEDMLINLHRGENRETANELISDRSAVNGACHGADAPLCIREVAVTDAEAAAKLSEELGYPVSPEEMQKRIRQLASFIEHIVYVASMADSVVGWIDVGIVHHLQAEAYGEIGGLVVSSEYRSLGIGRKLVAQAQEWARSRGVKRMVVRSRIAREAAHRFYLREGYERAKTSAVFSKALPCEA